MHIIGNGNSAAIVFFGAFLVTALAGIPSIDGKLAQREPGTWQALSAATSIVPFGAIAQGRNRLVLREFGWRTPLIAIIVWVAAAVFASMAVRRGTPSMPLDLAALAFYRHALRRSWREQHEIGT